MKLKIFYLVLVNLVILALNIPFEGVNLINLGIMLFIFPLLVLLIISMIFVTFNQKITKTKKRFYVSSFILSFIFSLISLFLYSMSFDKADLTSYSQLSLFDKIAPGIFFSLSVLVFINSIFFVSYMDKKILKS